jgi:hypothetical protein
MLDEEYRLTPKGLEKALELEKAQAGFDKEEQSKEE